MFLWKNLIEDKDRCLNQDWLDIGCCIKTGLFSLLHIGRKRIFHRINLEYLITWKNSIISPRKVAGLFDYYGFSSKYYLQLFPHRMVHLGNIDMTCYKNNVHPIVFSFSIDKLEKKYSDLIYMDQGHYQTYCSELIRELAKEGDQECLASLKEAEKRIIQKYYLSSQDQRDCEIVLSEIDLKFADCVLVFNQEDIEPLKEWFQTQRFTKRIFNFSNAGLMTNPIMNKVEGFNCPLKQCKCEFEGNRRILENALDSGAFSSLNYPEECPINED